MPVRRLTTAEVVERDLADVEIELCIEWRFDNGTFIETRHRYNGYGAGWKCHLVEAHALTGHVVELTEAEIEKFMERYSAQRIGDD